MKLSGNGKVTSLIAFCPKSAIMGIKNSLNRVSQQMVLKLITSCDSQEDYRGKAAEPGLEPLDHKQHSASTFLLTPRGDLTPWFSLVCWQRENQVALQCGFRFPSEGQEHF